MTDPAGILDAYRDGEMSLSDAISLLEKPAFSNPFLCRLVDAVERIETKVDQILRREKRMSDVLDTIIANQGTEEADLSEVQTLITKQQADIAALKSGQIPVTDPRFQTVLDSQAKMLTAFSSLLPTPPAAPAAAAPVAG